MNEKLKIITPPGLTNKICWKAEYSKQLNMSIDLGNPYVRSLPPRIARKDEIESPLNRRMVVRGEWWIWIYYAYWTISVNNKVVATTSSTLKNIKKATHFLVGRRVHSMMMSPSDGHTILRFEDEVTINIRRRSEEVNDLVIVKNKRTNHMMIRSNGKFIKDNLGRAAKRSAKEISDVDSLQEIRIVNGIKKIKKLRGH